MISFKERSKRLMRKYGFWVFAIVMGIVLIFWEDEEDVEPFFSFAAFLYWCLIIYWSARWLFGQIKSTLKQKREKTNVELMHLQSQVNPHFFFNTLNNLYGLIDQDTEKAKNMVLKLSDMMRYSIYDGQKESVTLEEELEYIENYVDLHKTRYQKETDIKLSHDIQQTGVRVMPLLFVILLENAFKHGVENLRENAYVHISLTGNQNEVIFSIENNFDPEELSEKEGIGLNNLKRRLELVYPNKHSLSFSVDNNIYKAQLTIKPL